MNIVISLFSSINDINNKTGSIPCFYETIIKNFENAGNNIFVHVSKEFNKNYKKLPANLLKILKDFNPDLFIFFNNTFYDVSKLFDCPILVYEVDSPLFYSNKETLKSNISRYKFIVNQDESTKILINEYGANRKNIIKVPFFTEIQAENVPIKHNISFIGSKFINIDTKYINIFLKFMRKNPSPTEINIFKNLINEFIKNPFVDENDVLKRLNITSTNIIEVFDKSKFIGDYSDYIRTKTLSCIADLGLGLYGTPAWILDRYNEPDIILSYINELIYTLKQNQDVYNSSKIGININHIQAVSGFSWRVCDIMASNACLVSEYKPNMEKYFAKVNIPMFNNPYEAREICQSLLKDENKRNDIVCASNEIINSKYRFKHVKKEIEDFLGFELAGTNENNVTQYYVEQDTELQKFIKVIKRKTKNRIKKTIGLK